MKIYSSVLVLAAVSAIGSVAHADVSIVNNNGVNVQIYGVADAAVGNVQNSLNVDPQFPASVNPYSPIKASQAGVGATSGLFNGGISPSRFGIKGDMDVGSGVKSFFVLESAINVTTGQLSNAGAALATNGRLATTDAANSSIDGQLFSRQAYVGLADRDLGSLAMGRTYAPIFDVTVAYDPVQASQLFSPLGFSGTLGGGGGVSEDTRVDNSLKYTNKFGNFNVTGQYKFGGVASAGSQGSAFGGQVGYDNGQYGVQLGFESFQDAIKGGSASAATPTASVNVFPLETNSPIGANQVAVTVYNTNAFMLAGKYKLNDDVTLKAGYESYTLGAPTTVLSTANYYGQSVQSVTNFSAASQTTNVYFIGGDYNITPKMNVAAGYYDVSLQQSADLGQKSGDQTYVSVLLDYHFTPMLDTYAGAMFAQYSGDAYPSASYYTSNQIFAVGARFKF